MIKFNILNRFSGNVQFTAEIECSENLDTPAKVGRAVIWGIKNGADMRGADISGANMRYADMSNANMESADMSCSDMRYADLRSANMCGADMRGADISCADISGANMLYANLYGAKLYDANMSGSNIIYCGTRSDGHKFYAHIRNGVIWIKSGCRYFAITDAARYWKETRSGTLLGYESQQLLKNARELVKMRNLLEVQS